VAVPDGDVGNEVLVGHDARPAAEGCQRGLGVLQGEGPTSPGVADLGLAYEHGALGGADEVRGFRKHRRFHEVRPFLAEEPAVVGEERPAKHRSVGIGIALIAADRNGEIHLQPCFQPGTAGQGGVGGQPEPGLLGVGVPHAVRPRVRTWCRHGNGAGQVEVAAHTAGGRIPVGIVAEHGVDLDESAVGELGAGRRWGGGCGFLSRLRFLGGGLLLEELLHQAFQFGDPDLQFPFPVRLGGCKGGKQEGGDEECCGNHGRRWGGSACHGVVSREGMSCRTAHALQCCAHGREPTIGGGHVKVGAIRGTQAAAAAGSRSDSPCGPGVDTPGTATYAPWAGVCVMWRAGRMAAGESTSRRQGPWAP